MDSLIAAQSLGFIQMGWGLNLGVRQRKANPYYQGLAVNIKDDYGDDYHACKPLQHRPDHSDALATRDLAGRVRVELDTAVAQQLRLTLLAICGNIRLSDSREEVEENASED